MSKIIFKGEYMKSFKEIILILGVLSIFFIFPCCQGGEDNLDMNPSLDTTPPNEVSNLSVIVTDFTIDISWENPNDKDFSEVKVDITSSLGETYERYCPSNCTGWTLPEMPIGTYVIRVRTIDISYNYSSGQICIATIEDNMPDNGNISDDTEDNNQSNDENVDSEEDENLQVDKIPPMQVVNLVAEYSSNENTITVSWINPQDEDFAGTEIIYGKVNSDETSRLAFDNNCSSAVISGIIPDYSEYIILVKTKDTSGNLSDAVSTNVFAENISEIKNKLINKLWVMEYGSGRLSLVFSNFNVVMKEIIDIDKSSIEINGFWIYKNRIITISECAGFSGDYKVSFDGDTLTLVSVNDETIIYSFNRDYTPEIGKILIENDWSLELSDTYGRNIYVDLAFLEESFGEVNCHIAYVLNNDTPAHVSHMVGSWTCEKNIISLTSCGDYSGIYILNYNLDENLYTLTSMEDDTIVFD